MGQGAFPAPKPFKPLYGPYNRKPHSIYGMLSFTRQNSGMTDDLHQLSEDKLLLMPELATGDIAPLWAVRSNILHARELAEIYNEHQGTTRPRMLFAWNSPREQEQLDEKRRRDKAEYEQQMRDITARQDALLRRIEYEQAVIEKQRQDCEANALRLRDGRRVYVDGDRYRDGQGNFLSGADEAEAARQHEVRPDASTWARMQDIDRRAADAKAFKDSVTADREATLSGRETPDTAQRHLSAYEKELADNVGEGAVQPVADYSSADYMSHYQLSSAPAFTAAADPASRETIRKPTDKDSQTAEIKNTPQPFGQTAPKLG
jgi:hypothetical protein